MSTYQTGYNFKPGEDVWVVNRSAQSIHHGICTQVDIRIYKDATGLSTTPTPSVPIIDHLVYWVLLDNEIGSVRVLDQDAFTSLQDALNALSANITPTPTPTPTVTPSVSLSMTPEVTPTPSMSPLATLTPTPSVTSTITPTVTATVTPTVTATVTPSITATMTPTPSSSLSSGDYSSVITSDSPVVYYQFAESSGNILIDSISANNATFIGLHNVRSNDGIGGKSLDFDTTPVEASGAEIGIPILLDTTNDFAIEFWMKPVLDFNLGNICILGSESNPGIFMTTTDNNFASIKFTGTNANESPSSYSAPNNQWSHIVINYDASIGFINYYINGSLNTITPTDTADFSIKYINTHVDGNLGTHIDEVAIYDNLLSLNVIREHYFSGLNNMTPTITLTPTPTVTMSPTPMAITPTPSAVAQDNQFTMVYREFNNVSGTDYFLKSFSSGDSDFTSSLPLNVPDLLPFESGTTITFTNNGNTVNLFNDINHTSMGLVKFLNNSGTFDYEIQQYDNAILPAYTFNECKLRNGHAYAHGNVTTLTYKIYKINYDTNTSQINYPPILNEFTPQHGRINAMVIADNGMVVTWETDNGINNYICSYENGAGNTLTFINEIVYDTSIFNPNDLVYNSDNRLICIANDSSFNRRVASLIVDRVTGISEEYQFDLGTDSSQFKILAYKDYFMMVLNNNTSTVVNTYSIGNSDLTLLDTHDYGEYVFVDAIAYENFFIMNRTDNFYGIIECNTSTGNITTTTTTTAINGQLVAITERVV